MSVLVAGLPHDSASARRYADPETTGWDVTAYLVADLYQAFTGERHPGRPTPKTSGPSRYAALRSRLQAQRSRLAEASPAAPDPPV